jgi:soluble lytic murein transglycosylase-like protein
LVLRTTVKLLVRPVLVTATVLALVATSQAGLSGRRPVGPPGASYKLQWGDTLTSVAAKYGISVEKLAAANGITNIHRVQAGMKLAIPSPTGSAATPAAPAPTSKLPVGLLARPERLALAPTFDHWAKAYNVPADLLKALAWMESGWQNSVVSPVAALGIGQLTPDTVKFVSGDLLKTKLDPKNPEHNIRMSSRFLRYLLDQTGGDTKMALAAYYQGLGSLRRQGPLKVSEAYVNAILALRPQFSA